MPGNDLHTWLFALSALAFLIGAFPRVDVSKLNLQSLGFALAAAATAVLYA